MTRASALLSCVSLTLKHQFGFSLDLCELKASHPQQIRAGIKSTLFGELRQLFAHASEVSRPFGVAAAPHLQ